MDAFELLQKMNQYEASDLYLTSGLPPSWRGTDFKTETQKPLSQMDITQIVNQLTTEEERKRFAQDKELNVAVVDHDNKRYRVNMFYQQQNIGLVIRKMHDYIPDIEELKLNQSYLDAIMENRGLILVTGMSGSGKSTSIASMIDYRNKHGSGHIITIEDPIEYVHKHNKCIFTQREVGFDTHSWHNALKNALRQRPDVIYIGEIRDAETMGQAMNFAETGHLCIATLHATSASQAIERIVNFFPAVMKEQYLYSLAHVLKYIFAQRLVLSKNYQKVPAIEILKNVGFVKPLIMQGKIGEIRDLMSHHSDFGMMSFENSLIDLLQRGIISEETAIAESDNPDNMRLAIMKGKIKPSQGGYNNKSQF